MKTKLLSLLFLLVSLWSYGQSCGALMTPLSIENRTSESTTIVEGIVTNSQSYWDVNQQNIYTVHTVDIYKRLTPGFETTLQVVTMGGQVGDMMQTVSDAAILHNGDTALFFLKNFNGNLPLSEPLYAPVGNAQGVVKYSRFDNSASDVFSKYNDVDTDLYNSVRAVIRTNFQVVSERPISNTLNKNSVATPIISNFSPTTATAGTQTILTINGNNFGNALGSVSFPNTNTGGATYTAALDSEIVSWTDTQIQVEIPWLAGTGDIAVTNATSESGVSSSILTIRYSHVNGTTATTAYPSTVPDDSDNGGFEFIYHSEFNTSSAKPYFEEAFNVWNCESNINFEFGNTTTVDVTAQDGVNIVRFDNGNELPSSTLGRVTAYSGVCGAKALVLEMDITWNDDINWYYGDGNPSATQLDFKSVALHELGHAHRLGHVIDPSSVMHYATGPGLSSYNLSQNEIDGAVYTMSFFEDTIGCGATPMIELINCCEDILIIDEIFDGNVAENGSTNLDFDANHYDSIQWQVSTDNGASWTDITDDANYSGTNGQSLNINNVPLNFNGNLYRAFLNNPCNNSTTTSEVTLTVTVYTSIPDSNFEAALSAYDDISNDGLIPTDNINILTSLNVDNANISDLTGIEDFTNLESLSLNDNSVSTLDLTGISNLTVVSARNNGLTALDVSTHTNMDVLLLENNSLTSIDVSNNSNLTRLWAQNNNVNALDVSNNPLLRAIGITDSNLTSLDLTQNTALEQLYAGGNAITALDLSQNSVLRIVGVNNNNLSSLNVKNGNNTNVTTFAADSNPNLNCILVDDGTYSTTNWTSIDAQTSFSDTSCGYTAVPDTIFEARLEALGYDDIPNDGQVPTWLINGVTTLNVFNLGITDLTGIEDFTALIDLNCSRNSLVTLNMQGNPNLEVLNCEINAISSINLSQNTALLNLNCDRNSLQNIDLQNNTALQTLAAERNSFTSLDFSANNNLEVIDVDQNSLTSIDVSNNSNLRSLSIKQNNSYNQLLDLSNNPNLEILICDRTNIPSLDLSNNPALTIVQAQINNSLTTINLSGAANLEQLLLYDTQVNALDASDCAALTELNVRDTQITTLDVSANGLLETVDVSDNDLSFFNIKNQNNTAITNFDASNNPSLFCILVDDTSYSDANWTSIDAQTIFSTTSCYTQIPDSNFEAALGNLGYDDIPGDGQVPKGMIAGVTNLNVNNKSISDLTGIQDFVSLTDLRIAANNFTSLDLTTNTTLEVLDAADCGLTSVNITGLTQLRNIYFSVNELTSLDFSAFPNLENIAVNNNELTALNLRNGANANIASLDTRNNDNLTCILIDNLSLVGNDWFKENFTSYTETNYCGYTVIPDSNFEAALNTLGYDDIPDDGQVPNDLISNVTSLDVASNSITNLTGIEGFTSLQILNASGNDFSAVTIDALTQLLELNLANTNISSLNTSNNTLLKVLRVDESSVTSLDITNNTQLETLNADDMGVLTDITFGNNALLKTVIVSGNQLTSIDLSPFPLLTTVRLNNNNFTTIDLRNGNNTAILDFNAVNNPGLICISVDDAVYSTTNWTGIEGQMFFSELDCRYTAIPDTNFESLLDLLDLDDISGDGQVPTSLIENLESIAIESFNIVDLTGIEDFTALLTLNAKGNAIAAADFSNNVNLVEIDLDNNPITSIDISQCTSLETIKLDGATLNTIDVSNNLQLLNVSVQNASLSSIDLSANVNVQTVILSNNALTSVDLSTLSQLDEVRLDNNNLSFLDLRNGNNSNIPANQFDLSNNQNLTCIFVSDATYAIANWTQIDGQMLFTGTDYCDYTAIPDSNFETRLGQLGYDDVANDGQVPTALITTVTSLNVNNRNISDLTGIEDFTALEFLTAQNNQLTALDLSTNTELEDIILNNNNLTSINVSGLMHLQELNLNFNDFITLDLSTGSSIEDLLLNDNVQLTTLNLSNNTSLANAYLRRNTALSSVTFGNNPWLVRVLLIGSGITTLDVSPLLELSTLDVSDTNITALDVSANTSLKNLFSLNTPISFLNIKNGNNTNSDNADIRITNTPNLFCVLVDDATYSTNTWTTFVDPQVSFSDTYCRYTQIPDTNFEAALDNLGYDDIAGDGQVPTALIENVTTLEVPSLSIADLTGIEDFAALTLLNANNNLLTSIDVSEVTTLEQLLVSTNNLTSIDLSTLTQLTRYQGRFNSYSSLDFSNNVLLDSLNVDGNANLTNINISQNPLIELLDLSECGISSLDISHLTDITSLDIGNNMIGNIDFTNNIALEEVFVSNNPIGTVDVSNLPLLQYFEAINSSLTALNIQNGNNTNIMYFDITQNPNLTCVLVDDATYSTTNWTDVDAQTNFSDTYCNYTAIPDSVFEAELNDLGYDDIAGDGQVPTALIENVSSLLLEDNGISDITGIEDFTALEHLTIRNATIASVDLSANTQLKILHLDDCAISNLLLNNNPLFEDLEFDSSNEQSVIANLDLSNCPLLKVLDASNIGLTNLTLPNTLTYLEKIALVGNNIESLDLSTAVALTDVFVQDNSALSYLNVQNGNNTNVNFFRTLNTPNLSCVLVDDATYSAANWTDIDATMTFSDGVYCNYTAIPDANFEAELNSLGYDDIANDGQVPTALIEVVTDLTLLERGLTDMTGIEDFASLVNLNLKENDFTTIDLSQNSLLEVVELEECVNLVSIDISGNPLLRVLDFNQTEVSTIDLSDAPLLETIDASGSNLSSIDLSNNPLVSFINIGFTNITTLDVSYCTSLTYLYAANNDNLSSLNVKNDNNTSVTNFNARNNPNLTCILVDDAVYSTANWTNIDATASFNDVALDCEAPSIVCPSDINVNSVTGICGANVTIPVPAVSDNNLGCVQSDDLEMYDAGQLLGQGGDWDTWTPNTPAQSANITTEQAFSGTKSLKVEGIASGGPAAMKFNLGNRSFGAWEVIYHLYIPAGNTAYCNMQKSETSGTEWADQIQFNSDGTGDYNVRSNLYPFNYPQDTWFEVKYVINIDGDYSEIFINGESVFSHPFSDKANGINGLLTLGSVVFYPITNFFGNDPNSNAIPLFYVDDLSLCPVAVNDFNGSANASDIYPIGTTDVVWSYTDEGANVATCTQIITVNDLEAPEIVSCTSDITVPNDVDQCGAVVNYDIPVALVNCNPTIISGFQYIGTFDTNVYYVSNTVSNGPDAFANAEALNGFVATITSQEHNDWLLTAVTDAIGEESVFIGYNDLAEEGAFEWHSGNTATYTNWNGNEPNDAAAGEDYAEMRSNGRWNDLNSTVERRYVIEISGFLTTQVAGLPSGSEFPIGTTTNIFEATDAAGNTATCSFDVTVNDVNDSCTISIAPKVFLQGAALNPNTGEENLMRDDLRVAGLLPTMSPYTDDLTCDASVFNTTGADAIVDWVWVELRDATDNTLVSYSRSALLQRDGDVVDVDGTSALDFTTIDDTYYLVINHRSHLGIMTANTITFTSGTTVISFLNAGNSFLYGTNARTSIGMPTGIYGMWAGDADGDGILNYNNDGNSILFEVLFDPTNTSFSSLYNGANDYYSGDMDLNGNASFQADLNNLLFNILFHPSNTSFSSLYSIQEQLPDNSSLLRKALDNELLERRAYIAQKLQDLQNQINNN